MFPNMSQRIPSSQQNPLSPAPATWLSGGSANAVASLADVDAKLARVVALLTELVVLAAQEYDGEEEDACPDDGSSI